MNFQTKIFFAIIILINLFLYNPAFFDTARGIDQKIFLSEIAHIQSLPELINDSYSYTRTREHMQGDKILFIPLCFLLLAFEKYFFGYDFFWWQITGFLLHLIAQWTLFRILNIFASTRWSFLIVLLSSVLFLQQEMVMRHHLNGYLFFQIFGLTAIYQFFKYCEDTTHKRKYFINTLICLSLAYFAHLGSMIINILFIALLNIPKTTVFTRFPPRHKVLIWLPMLIYFGISATDFGLKVKDFSFINDGLTGSVQAGIFNLGAFLSNITNLSSIGFQGFLFPAFTKIKLIGDQYNYSKFSWPINNPLELLNTGLAIFYFAFLTACIYTAIKDRKAIKQYWDLKTFILGIFMFLLTISYIALLCLTRLQLNPDYIRTAPHHFYFIYSFSLISCYHLTLPFLLFVDQNRPKIKAALLIVLLSLILIQGYFLYQLNSSLRVHGESQRIFLRQIERFVKEHRKEPDFSFTLQKSELIYLHIIQVNENKRIRKNLIELLFPNYVRINNPKYYLLYTKSEGLRAFETKTLAEQAVKLHGQWNIEMNVNGKDINFEKLLWLRSLSNEVQKTE